MSDVKEVAVNKRAGLDAAMASIKAELSPVMKDGVNPHFKSSFATLNAHLRVVEPILQKYGCSLRQPTQFVGGQNVVISAIIHTASGQEASASLGLGEQKDMQKLGGAITYARRYTLSALLSMQAEDDDGATAVGTPSPSKTVSKKGDW